MTGPARVDAVCICGQSFRPRAADVARGWGKYCSKGCAMKAKQAVDRKAATDQTIEALKNAGRRTYEYCVSYGVDAVWSVTDRGLTLRAQYGMDKVERSLYWAEVETFKQSLDNAMLQLEKSALAGLSS